MRLTPRMTISATAPGNSRLRCRGPAERRPPARAARATFLADDALPISAPRYLAERPRREPWDLAGSGASAGRPPGPQLLEQCLVPLGDRSRRHPALDEGPARGPHGPGLLGPVEQLGHRRGERRRIV